MCLALKDMETSQRDSILVVSRSTADIEVLSNQFKGMDVAIHTAQDGQMALEAAFRERPGLILLDSDIAGISSPEICRRLKAMPQTRVIPIIMIAPSNKAGDTGWMFKVGAVDFINKPFQREEVLARVETHLCLRQIGRRLKETRAALNRMKTKSAEEPARKEQVASPPASDNQDPSAQCQCPGENEKRLRTLVENLPMKVFIKDRDSVYIICSPSYARDLGIQADEIQGKTDYDLRPRPQAEKYRRDDRRVMTSGRGEKQVQRYVRNGQHHWVHTIKIPLLDEADQIKGILGVFWDITGIKRLEAQLSQVQKMEAISNLAGGVAHDFNNLMTSIIGFSDLLLQRLDQDDPLRPDIVQIRKAGQSAASLTSQLLAFSRKQTLEPISMDLNHAVAEMQKMLQRLIGEDILLQSKLASDLNKVRADPTQIEQVIVNLAVNARDAMPSGGRLIIETANRYLDEDYAQTHIGMPPGHYVRLSVSDTGKGMDEKILSHIFEPFFTTKASGKGTGLGLATVYGIVQRSGGHIWVYSEPGMGTTFKIYLPRLDEGAHQTVGQAAMDEISHQLIQKGSGTILLVEDDAVLRRLAAKGLDMSGYAVLQAQNGEEALKLLNEHKNRIDLLVTDVVMPGMSGGELAERVSRLYPGIKVLFISGYADSVITHHGVTDGGPAFLEKPFTLNILTQKIRDLLDQGKDQAV